MFTLMCSCGEDVRAVASRQPYLGDDRNIGIVAGENVWQKVHLWFEFYLGNPRFWTPAQNLPEKSAANITNVTY